jgi:hypothetical protein
MTARGKELTGTVDVRIDPVARTSPAALQARFAASQRVAALAGAFSEAAAAIDGLSKQMEAIRNGIKGRDDIPKPLLARVDEVSKSLDKSKALFRAGFGGPKFQVLDLAGQLQASTSAPTDSQMTTIDHLTAKLTENITALNALITTEFPQLESDLRGGKINLYVARPVALPKVK